MGADLAQNRRAADGAEPGPYRVAVARSLGLRDADSTNTVERAQQSGVAAGPVADHPEAPGAVPLRVVSYNVHSCIGIDGRRDPERVLAVLRELRPDVIGLQEVDSRSGRTGTDQFACFARVAGMEAVEGPVVYDQGGGYYGNALLSRLPLVEARTIDLSQPGREPRGAIVARLELGGGRRLRVVNTHLGLSAAERSRQVARLLEVVDEAHADGPTVLLGDLNEWFPFSRRLRDIRRRFARSPGLTTFPSVLPVLALDRIWCSPDLTVARVAAHRSAPARRASDHLPIVADLRFAPG